MAQGRFRKGTKPHKNIVFSVNAGTKERPAYKKCETSIGLWPNEDSGPEMRGTVQGDYLRKVHEFLGKCVARNLAVSVAMFGPYQASDKTSPQQSDGWGDAPQEQPKQPPLNPDEIPF